MESIFFQKKRCNVHFSEISQIEVMYIIKDWLCMLKFPFLQSKLMLFGSETYLSDMAMPVGRDGNM